MGGGLLGGLLAASQNAARAKKAEAAIEPVRIALTGFDVDSLAQDTANTAIAALPWLQPTSVTFGKDSSVLGKSALLDKGGADQIAFLEYAYDFSPDFSAVRVVETIQFANRALPAASTPLKPEVRLSPKYAPYAQSVTSVVELSAPSKEMIDNATRWSADNGKLAKAALVSAFAEIRQLTPRLLDLGAEDVKLLDAKENKRIMAGGYSGRPQSSKDGGTLLWTGGFVHVQTLQ